MNRWTTPQARHAAPVDAPAGVPGGAAELLNAGRPTPRARRAPGARDVERVWQRRILIGLLACADLSVFIVAMRLAQWTSIAPWLPDALRPSEVPSLRPLLPLWLALVFPTLVARGLYKFRYRDGLYSIGRAASSVLLAGAALVVLLFFLAAPIPRGFVALVVGYSAFGLGLARLVFRRLASKFPPLCRRVLVVGSGDIAESLARMIYQYRHQGFHLVETLALAGAAPRPFQSLQGAPRSRPPAREDGVVQFDRADQIEGYVRALTVDDVVVTREWYDRNCPDIERVFAVLRSLSAQVHVASNFPELLLRMSVEDFSGLPLVSLSTLSVSRWQLAIKRALDVAAALALLILLSPLFLAIALAIRLNSRGPAIFKQARVGRYHRPFTIYKFRTMEVDREGADDDAAGPAPDGKPDDMADGGPHKRRGDPRITPVGRRLRRMSLDELPQLVNVLKGDMSLIGPRPELPEIVRGYAPWQYVRLIVPPGITGWWQVNGRGERLLHRHTEDDLYYVRNFSLLLDAKILLMTVKAVLTGHGAF